MNLIVRISIMTLLSISSISANNLSLPELEAKSISDETETADNKISENKISEYYKLKKDIAKKAEKEKFDYDKRRILEKIKIKLGVAQQQYSCVKNVENEKELEKCANQYITFLNNAVIKSKIDENLNTEFEIDKGFD